jgi:KDO2-lipid IV(A) lauroyltransferase
VTLVGFCVRGLVWLARPIPIGLLATIGAGLGWIWYRLIPIRRSVARENIAGALDLDRAGTEPVVAAMYRHLGCSAAELVALDRIAARARIVGLHHLTEALTGGRGVLLLSAHLGNWEVLVRVATRAERPVFVVTKHLTGRLAERIWRQLRSGGAELLHERGAGRAIRRALADNAIVAFVLDQHEAGRGRCVVPFFGRPAATSTGLARLARRTGAPVLPIFTFRAPDGVHEVEIGAPVELPMVAGEPDPAGDTACLVGFVERAVRAHPEQWLWIHRRWKVGGTFNRDRRPR